MEDRWLTDGKPSERFSFYTRANSGEVLPPPTTPLGWDLVWSQGVAQGWADGLMRWGAMSSEEIDRDHPQVIDCFGGYLYLNWSMIRVTGERSPGMSAAMMDAAFFGDHPDIPPHVAHPDDDRPDLAAKIGETMEWVMGTTEVPAELGEDRAAALELRAQRPDLAGLSDAELVARARSLVPWVREFFEPYFVYGIASSIGMGILTELCAPLEAGIVGRLISGLGNIDSTPPSYAVWDLSRTIRESLALTSAFDSGVDGVLERLAGTVEGDSFLVALADVSRVHGARGPIEWEIANSTWETNPEHVAMLVDRLRLADDDLSPEERHRRAATDRSRAETEARTAFAGNQEALATLDLGMRLADVFVAGRERTKLTEMLAIHEIRMPVHELGRRMVERNLLQTPTQVTMLRDQELDAFIEAPESLLDVIADREAGFAQLQGLQEPFIVYGEVPPLSEWPARTATSDPVAVGDELQGVSGSPGVATGRARIITDPRHAHALEPGDILVAPLTDPAWTPLFLPAKAIVVEVGAPMSHAMIVSREFGLPCVTGVTGATTRIPEGALLQIDGNTGIITVLEV